MTRNRHPVQIPDTSDQSLSVTAYDRSFWLAYLGMTLLTTGYGLLYRYADFVTFLGGSEFHIGWIVGMGMIGSLAMRLFLGVGIDRYGPRLIWSTSLCLVSISCFGHLAISSYSGLGIYFLRITFACGMAGIFGSSITFISNRIATNRVAELVGMLGTSGYVGIMVGSQLGDFLCGTAEIQQWQVYGLFVAAGFLSVSAIPFVWLATSGIPRPERRQQPSMFKILRHYNPGIIIAVGIVAGLGLGLPEVFLRTFAITLDMPRIGLFFTTYAITTIATRLMLRSVSERMPLKPMILCGLGCLAISMMSFIVVRSYWQLIIPGIGFGITQAMLAPSVIAAANTNFPARFRGLGTTLVLASFDLGYLVGAPSAGAILHFSRLAGLPAYPILFATIVVVIIFAIVVYAITPARRPSREQTVEWSELLSGGELLAAADCPVTPQSTVASKCIDPLKPSTYHPAVEFDETRSLDACGTAGKPETD